MAGKVAQVLSSEWVERGEIFVASLKVDFGGVLMTADYLGDANANALPMPGDYVALLDTEREGGHVAIGAGGAKGTPVDVPGERVTYARDENGDVVSYIFLLQDGSIDIRAVANDGTGAQIQMLANGQIIINTFDGANVVINSDNHVTVNAEGNVNINSVGDVVIDTDGEADINGVTIAANGAVDANGVTIDASGAMSVPTSLTVAGKELAAHLHTGSPSAPDGPPTPTGANL